MKRAIIIGATSGIGQEVAKCLLNKGWSLGIAGRRMDALEKFQAVDPQNIVVQTIDVSKDNASDSLLQLISKLGGVDLFFHAAGVGHQNHLLEENIELQTAETNVLGFIRIVTAAFRYFRDNGGGHIAVISSIAGTKGLGSAPAYSATKRFQNTYIEALAQLAYMEKAKISFTDIRPGFVDTALLNDNRKYPMLMRPEYVAAQIVKALERKKRVVTIDWRYRVMVFFWRLIPRFVWEHMKIKN